MVSKPLPKKKEKAKSLHHHHKNLQQVITKERRARQILNQYCLRHYYPVLTIHIIIHQQINTWSLQVIMKATITNMTMITILSGIYKSPRHHTKSMKIFTLIKLMILLGLLQDKISNMM